MRSWREYKKDMIKQKFLGFCLLAVAVASVFIEGDGTFALLMAPAGAYLMITVKDYMHEEDD